MSLTLGGVRAWRRCVPRNNGQNKLTAIPSTTIATRSRLTIPTMMRFAPFSTGGFCFSAEISAEEEVADSKEESQVAPVENMPRTKVVCRTPKSDPTTFDETDLGLFYTVPKEKYRQLFHYGPEPRFQAQTKVISEAAFMIRRPFLELRELLRVTDVKQPVRKYLVHGLPGAGKTMTLNSLLHYASVAGWMIVHIPWPLSWFHPRVRDFRDQTEISSWNPRRIDLPYICADWLRNFRVQNAVILSRRKDLVTTKTYTWTRREETPQGSHLTALIDFGLERVRYSTDCVGAILRELRLANQHLEQPLPVYVSIDGVNLFWNPTTLPRPDQGPKIYVPPDTVALIHNLKKMLRTDWNGGAVVASLDADKIEEPWIMNRSSQPFDSRSMNPREVLGKEGFRVLEPYYPVSIPNYDPDEFSRAVAFYEEKKLIQLPSALTGQGFQELSFLSNRNPGFLHYMTGIL